MDKYYPDGDKTSNIVVVAYLEAQTLVQALKQCGDNLTRENVMKQSANLKDPAPPAPRGEESVSASSLS